MTKLRLFFLFLIGMLGSLLVATLPFLIISYHYPEYSIIRQAFLSEVLGLPLIVYLVIGSILFGLLLVGIERFSVTQLDRRHQQSLDQILRGNYVTKVKAKPNETSPTILFELKLNDLNEKIISLQQELQVYSNQPLRFEGETRQQILEGEQHRLARELHDSVSQQLFAAMMMLSALSETGKASNVDASYQQMITRIEQVVNEAQSEMRALLLHLRPTSLEGRSLKEGIIQLLKELQTKINIKISWEMDDVRLKSGIEDNLFRIVQELLSNTLRHAHADQMQVFLKQVEQTVVLRVVDNGVGFDMKQQENAGSYGLSNIRERAEAVGGMVRTISFKNEGTSVEIRVPIMMEEDND